MAVFFNAKSLVGVTTGTGTAFDLRGDVDNVTVYVTATGTVSGGTVRIEEADDAAFSGTWSQIQDVTPITNAVVAVHLTGAIAAIRARITSNITGGATVDVRIVAHDAGGF